MYCDQTDITTRRLPEATLQQLTDQLDQLEAEAAKAIGAAGSASEALKSDEIPQ